MALTWGSGALMPRCECERHAVGWIQHVFADCIYTNWELLAFTVGLSSIGCWLVAQLPQFLRTMKLRSADALSPWFLFQWLSGDILNLVGCCLTGDQLATQTYTAIYFIFADCCIISQLMYYKILNKDQVEVLADVADDSVHEPIKGYYWAMTRRGHASLTHPHPQPLSHRILIDEPVPPPTEALAVIVPGQQSLNLVPWLGKVLGGGRQCSQRWLTSGADEADVEELLPAKKKVKGRHHPHFYHPVSFVTGRSGAVMIAHAWQGPHDASDPPHPAHPPVPPPSAYIEVKAEDGELWSRHACPAVRAGGHRVLGHAGNGVQHVRQGGAGEVSERGEEDSGDETVRGGRRRGGILQSVLEPAELVCRQKSDRLPARAGAPKAFARAAGIGEGAELDTGGREDEPESSKEGRRHLRRVIAMYGLEYGSLRPPKRLTIHHNHNKHELREPLTGSRREGRGTGGSGVGGEEGQGLGGHTIEEGSSRVCGNGDEVGGLGGGKEGSLEDTLEASNESSDPAVNGQETDPGRGKQRGRGRGHVEGGEGGAEDFGGTGVARAKATAFCLAGVLICSIFMPGGSQYLGAGGGVRDHLTGVFQGTSTAGRGQLEGLGGRGVVYPHVSVGGRRLKAVQGRESGWLGWETTRDVPVSLQPKRLGTMCGVTTSSSLMKEVGLWLGWTSAVLYLGSRLAQLYKNTARQSAEGLSMTMFLCAFFANLTYGTAILMRANSWEDLMGKAPWLLGSMGTLSLDITIFIQAKYFDYVARKTQPKPCAESTLLV